MTTKRENLLKIAVLSEYIFTNRESFKTMQGSGFFGASLSLIESLASLGVEMEFITFRRERLLSLLRLAFRAVGRGDNPRLWSIGEFLAKRAGAHFRKALKSSNVSRDFLLCCDHSSLIAYVDVKIPLVIVRDAAIATVYEHYELRISEYQKFKSLENERLAYENATLIFLTSRWAVAAAQRQYPHLGQKFRVLFRGPSFSFTPTEEDVNQWIISRSQSCLEILFVAGDWDRKGGDLVIETCELLRRSGQNLRLRILGSASAGRKYPEWVEIVGYISKDSAEGEAKLSELYRKSHFVFVPSRAEIFGLFTPEANIHGVPAISTNVGGVSDAIQSGQNGFILDARSKAYNYAQVILSAFQNQEEYQKLCRSSFQYYLRHFNWKRLGQKLIDEVQFTDQGDRLA